MSDPLRINSISSEVDDYGVSPAGVSPAGVSLLAVVLEVMLSLAAGAAASGSDSAGAGGFGGWQPREMVSIAAAAVPSISLKADFIDWVSKQNRREASYTWEPVLFAQIPNSTIPEPSRNPQHTDCDGQITSGGAIIGTIPPLEALFLTSESSRLSAKRRGTDPTQGRIAKPTTEIQCIPLSNLEYGDWR